MLAINRVIRIAAGAILAPALLGLAFPGLTELDWYQHDPEEPGGETRPL
jgi:hypothetical protein